MSDSGLHTFTGNDLKVVDRPVEKDADTLSVTLFGKQENDDFRHECARAPEQITITLRRILQAHGIAISEPDIEFHKGRRSIEVNAELKRIAHTDHSNILDLIGEGMYLARPHHMNGRRPITNDRLRFTLQQGFISMGDDHLDLLPDKDSRNETSFSAYVETGRLIYHPSADRDDLPKLISDRLRYRPGLIDRYAMPIWQSMRDVLTAPGSIVGLRIRNFRAKFHTLVITTCGGEQTAVINSPDGDFFVFDQNTSDHPKGMDSVSLNIYDRRPRERILPDDPDTRASSLLTRSFGEADSYIERLTHLAGQMEHERPSALCVNDLGIELVRRTVTSEWVATSDMIREKNQLKNRQQKLVSSLSDRPNPVAEESYESPAIHLVKQAKKLGMDGRAIMVCKSFPQHAALDYLNASEVAQNRRVFDTILFGNASVDHGQFFSKHDYNSMRNLQDNQVDIYWANRNIRRIENGRYMRGALLKLTKLDKTEDNDEIFTSMAFVPKDRTEEFVNGFHLVFYGTARTLSPEYIEFMKQLFEKLETIRTSQSKPFVVHSGGGPDTSTMGIANRLGREHGMLSIGHVLGVKKEPMNKHLDGMMPFRNNARDLRQGNMAAAADIVFVLEGGGGTKEELGISLTDIAIVRKKPYPIVLVGSDYYRNEYLQCLKAVSKGNLDSSVLNCISLVDTADTESAEKITNEWLENERVARIIPSAMEDDYRLAVEQYSVAVQGKCKEWK